jgi:hypothetical protein
MSARRDSLVVGPTREVECTIYVTTEGTGLSLVNARIIQDHYRTAKPTRMNYMIQDKILLETYSAPAKYTLYVEGRGVAEILW